jgi:ribose transport system substrate-binding protein
MGAARAKVEKSTIAPGHGLTADTFCITVQKGAHAAADAPGAELVFLGAPDFNAVTQVPVPDATVGG